MRKYIIICDKCSKELTEESTASYTLGDNAIDLCSECKEEFKTFINIKISEWCEGASPVQTKGRAGRKKINIDYDKACALRSAGWSYDQIADELGCGASTIYRKLCEEGYYQEYIYGARIGGNNEEHG